ncbi:MAG: hypothetical protein WDO24_26925 [Pseudomonadota bacterium]
MLSLTDLEINGRPLAVQPVSIAYARLDGIPIGRAFRAVLRLVWRHGPGVASVAHGRAGHHHRGGAFPSADHGRGVRLAEGAGAGRTCGRGRGVAALLSGRAVASPPGVTPALGAAH